MTAYLTRARYQDLCAVVGPALDHPRPWVQEIGTPCGWPVGIYLLGHHHPSSNRFVVDYVGSAARPTSDVSARIREHLRDKEKARHFTGQAVLPLRSETPVTDVRRHEGAVARALDIPRWSRRVPGGRW